MRLHTHIGYIEKLLAKGRIDFVDQGNMAAVQQYMLLSDLFFHGIKEVHLEDDDSVIENSDIPLIKHFIKQGRIKPKQTITPLSTPTFDIHFDDSKQDHELKSSEKASGCFYANSKSDTQPIFGEYIQHFDRSENQDWGFATPLFSPHNSVVIVDAYLFTNHGMNGLISMFRKVLPKKLKQTYHITLVGKPRPTDKESNILAEKIIKEKIELLKNELQSHGLAIDLEYFFCIQPEIHDRYIFTNNMGAFLGSGVGIVAGDTWTPYHEGTWVVHRPYKRINFNGKQGVFFYDVLQKKLKVIKRWLNDSGYQVIKNPLIS